MTTFFGALSLNPTQKALLVVCLEKCLTVSSIGLSKVIHRLILTIYNRVYAAFFVLGLILLCLLTANWQSEKIGDSSTSTEHVKIPGTFDRRPLADYYYKHLLEEIWQNDGSMPLFWLVDRMEGIGLQTHIHNFTFYNPVGTPGYLSGRNVYGILRGSRSSEDALVLSAPYRPTWTSNLTTTPSIAVLLAMAFHARRVNRWGKNVIFLITEHEQLGMQAWLEAYHGVGGRSHLFRHGDFKRAGPIHAVINLEFHHRIFSEVDIKIAGLNGLVPSLDLYFRTIDVLNNHTIPLTFKNERNVSLDSSMMQMQMETVVNQILGIPDGNHGLFYGFGIHALTLKSVYRNNTKTFDFTVMGRMLEELFYGLNYKEGRISHDFPNLMVAPHNLDTFNIYTWIVWIMAATLIFVSYGYWFNYLKTPLPVIAGGGPPIKVRTPVIPEDMKKYLGIQKTKYEKALRTYKPSPHFKDWVVISCIILTVHLVGFFLMCYPEKILTLGEICIYLKMRCHLFLSTFIPFLSRPSDNFPPPEALFFYGVVLISIAILASPRFIPLNVLKGAAPVLYILALLELATILISVSCCNFALALYCGVIYVPLVMFLGVCRPSLCRVWFVTYPVFVLFFNVVVYMNVMFPEEGFLYSCSRGFEVTQQAIVSSLEQSMIYGNLVFNVVIGALLPNWMCFWIVAFAKFSAKNDSVK